jgi:hypothetical protein
MTERSNSVAFTSGRGRKSIGRDDERMAFIVLANDLALFDLNEMRARGADLTARRDMMIDPLRETFEWKITTLTATATQPNVLLRLKEGKSVDDGRRRRESRPNRSSCTFSERSTDCTPERETCVPSSSSGPGRGSSSSSSTSSPAATALSNASSLAIRCPHSCRFLVPDDPLVLLPS